MSPPIGQRGFHGIVPMVGAAALAPQQLPGHSLLMSTGVSLSGIIYHKGPLIRNVEISAAFIGNAWTQDATMSQVPPIVDAFLSMFVTCDVIGTLNQRYGQPPTWPIGPGKYNGAVILDTVALGASVDDSAIVTAISDAIQLGTTNPNAGGTLPPVTPNSLYIAFVPDGVAVTAAGEGTSCINHCGYHGDINGTPYAVIPYPSCTGCLPAGFTIAQALTTATSHEICESITNPLNTGWFRDADHAEIADICATPTWQTRVVSGYTIQKICDASGNCT